MFNRIYFLLAAICLVVPTGFAQDEADESQSSDHASIKSTIADDGTGRIIIEARGQLPKSALIYSARSVATAKVGQTRIEQSIQLDFKILQGDSRTVSLELIGAGQVDEVTGAEIESWAVRKTGKSRFLDIRLKKDTKTTKASVVIRSQEYTLPNKLDLTHFGPGDAVGFDSTIDLQFDSRVSGAAVETDGFSPLGTSAKANQFRSATGGQIKLDLNRSGAAPKPVELFDTTLKGELHASGDSIHFQLRGKVQVNEPEAEISILSGNAAIAEVPDDAGFRLRLVTVDKQSIYKLVFDKPGEYPLAIDFVAKLLRPSPDARATDFSVAASAVVPLRISGLAKDLDFHRAESFIVPVGEKDDWLAFLPASGRVRVQWKPSQKAGEGKLFFTTVGSVDATVSAGLLRQAHKISYQVLQGELSSLSLLLRGPGEILDVQGAGIVGWKIVDRGQDRQLDITLAQPLTGTAQVSIRSQTPLDSFPVRVQGLRLEPIGAIRHSGHLRLSNAGSVRLEPVELSGLTQLAPNQFPGKETKARQVFVYRFPSAKHDFSVAADRIQPEINVSQLVLYQLDETDRVMKADIELDIREAPIREWNFVIPADYSVVSVTGASVADYVAATEASDGARNLKIIFAKDTMGRQLVSVHLEKNEPATAGNWVLPKLGFPGAKTMRGDIGVVASPGFRVAVGESNLLADKPLSYFPKRVAYLQQAFRIREPSWSATMQIELLQRNVQSDVFHLYSLSQGTVYGSALINYFVTGAPVSEWRISAPKELGNVMVDGQDVRTWRREDDTLIVSLHQAVIGPYVLLVTFEEEPDGDAGSFQAGQIRPLDVQGERGYVQVVSPMQVEVEAKTVSDEMLVLDALELPTEFRLLTTAPSLGTWQYTERPFNLNLNVKWFQPGTMVSQVVEFSEANSNVSRDGELVTDVIYYVKSRGQRSLKVKLPAAPVRLWEVIVDGRPVTARQAGDATLIPLPGGTDPNVPVEVRLRLGKPTVSESYVKLTLPAVSAPVLKTQWNVGGDQQRTLIPASGTVSPPTPVVRPSGFHWLARRGLWYLVGVGLFAMIGAVTRKRKGSVGALGMFSLLVSIAIACVGAKTAISQIGEVAPLQLSLPVVTAGDTVELNVYNTPLWRVDLSWLGLALIVLGIGLLIWLKTKYANDYQTYRLPIVAASMVVIALGVLTQGGGAPWFFAMLAIAIFVLLFLHPAWIGYKNWHDNWKQKQTQRRERKAAAVAAAAEASETDGSDPGPIGPATATILMVLGSLMGGLNANAAQPGEFQAADSIQQEWILSGEEQRITASGTVKLTGQPGDQFLLLNAPAVLTKFDGQGLRIGKRNVPKHGLTYVVTIPLDKESTQKEPSDDDVDSAPIVTPKQYQADFQYLVESFEIAKGIQVPTGVAAVQVVEVQYDQPGWEITSASAVRIEPLESKATRVKLLLAPRSATLNLRPKARDVATEETQFFAEASNLFLPGPGVIDGRHRLSIRVPQGQLRELKLKVPQGLTVGSVDGPIGSWQFDADSGELRLLLEAAQSKAFELTIHTQRSLGPLPADVELAPLTVTGTSGEVGLLAVAFGPEAQPEKLDSTTMSLVNLGDFDASLVPKGKVVNRVYRYGSEGGVVSARIGSVEPEVRVISKQVLSLGDERVVLGINLSAEITRAGLFQLSFPLPDGLEVESLTGAALHHWAELTEDDQRKVILHLNGKTLGQQSFSITLAGPAPIDVAEWTIPHLQLNEANRQTGELIVQPTTGIRLRTVSRQNVSEADPRELGGKTQGALAFRLLQRDWNLVLGIEKLDPWVTGNVLHEVTLREGQTRSNLVGQFNVQNASIQSLQVTLPISDSDEIKTLRATGSQVSDFVRSGPNSNTWRVLFKRRVVGRVNFQIEYERRGERKDNAETLRPAKFPDARQISYHVAVRAGGRLEIETETVDNGWQQGDWNTVPQSLRESLNRVAPALTLRVNSQATELQIKAIRHSLADALKLRVANGTLTTVLSPTGHQLTAVDLTIEVIQRSSLNVGLPEGAELFSIFVNGESVHSIRQSGDKNGWQFYILPGIDERTAKVRFVYTVPGSQLTSLDLKSPELNVPLENINWKVVAPKGYELLDDDGNLELIRQSNQATYDRKSYLTKAKGKRQAQAQQATQLLQEANKFLQAGEQTKARWALNSVANQYALDAASNEDARVQLKNLQTQQAIVGLNTRRQRIYLDNKADVTLSDNRQMEQAAAANPILQQDELNFRPQQLSQLLQGNTREDNAVLQKIATRLVQHQRAAEPAPQAIIISLPEEGTSYTFRRTVQVAENSPLELDLGFRQLLSIGVWRTLLVLLILILVGVVLAWAGLHTKNAVS